MAAAPGKQQCREEQAQRHDGSPPALLLLRFCCLRLCAWIRAEAPGNSHDAWARKVRLLAAERRDEGATKASRSTQAFAACCKACPFSRSIEAGRAARVERHGLSVRSLPPNTAASYSPTLPPHRNSRCLISKRISIIGLNRKGRPNLSAQNDRAGIGASPRCFATGAGKRPGTTRNLSEKCQEQPFPRLPKRSH